MQKIFQHTTTTKKSILATQTPFFHTILSSVRKSNNKVVDPSIEALLIYLTQNALLERLVSLLRINIKKYSPIKTYPHKADLIL